MISLATRIEKNVLAQLKGIAKEEYCPISFLVRKAIDLLDETFQKPILPEHLLKRIPTPKHPVGITIRVSSLQARRVKTLAADENRSVSDLLRAAIQHFIILYEGPKAIIPAEMGGKIIKRLEDIAHEMRLILEALNSPPEESGHAGDSSILTSKGA